jgi:hypothetical protein
VLHPADLVISGKAAEATRVRIAIIERLAFSKACMTWTAQGNALEDRFAALWRDVQDPGRGETLTGAAADLQDIARDLEKIDLPYEEWEVLCRKRLLVECALLRKAGAALSDQEQTLGQARKTLPIAAA